MSNVVESGRVFQVVSVEWELPGEWGRNMDQWPVDSVTAAETAGHLQAGHWWPLSLITAACNL